MANGDAMPPSADAAEHDALDFVRPTGFVGARTDTTRRAGVAADS
jgi:hypothetical protein